MNTPSIDVIECESASVRLSNGEIFEFAVVDNKGLFPNCYKATTDFDIQIQCYLLENNTHAMYKKKDNIAYLICAWSSASEINDEAMKEITSNPKLAYLLN